MAVERDFIATCYEVFLGRELDSLAVADGRCHWPIEDVIASIAGSDEFDRVVARPLAEGRLPPEHLFGLRFSIRHRLWAADRLPLSPGGAEAAMRATDWWDFLRVLVGDETLMRVAKRATVTAAPLPSWLIEERFERRMAERAA